MHSECRTNGLHPNNVSPRERLVNFLLGKPVDRIPFMTLFGPWYLTAEKWRSQGMQEDDDWSVLFDFDSGLNAIPVNSWVCPCFEDKILADEGDTYVHVNEFGVVLRDRKKLDSMSQFLEHPVKDRKSWEKYKKERLQVDIPGRFPGNWDHLVKDYENRDYPLVLGGYPCGFFGLARWLIGAEELLMAYAADPEFILEINEHICFLWHQIWQKVLAEVKPDIVCFSEDIAGCQGSLISPAMFNRFLAPFLKDIFSLAKQNGIQIFMVDSDGFMEDMVGLFADTGVNCLYPWEVQAGNDLEKVRAMHPEMAFIGGIDKRAMATDVETMNKEIKRIEKLLSVGRFVPSPDHLIPPDVPWENYCYFVKQWRKMIYGYKSC